jgi:predicted translin family RNA/ssDNA-binding protein
MKPKIKNISKQVNKLKRIIRKTRDQQEALNANNELQELLAIRINFLKNYIKS